MKHTAVLPASMRSQVPDILRSMELLGVHEMREKLALQTSRTGTYMVKPLHNRRTLPAESVDDAGEAVVRFLSHIIKLMTSMEMWSPWLGPRKRRFETGSGEAQLFMTLCHPDLLLRTWQCLPSITPVYCTSPACLAIRVPWKVCSHNAMLG